VRSYPRVVSPITRLFTRDRVEVVLVSVEVWRQHLVVRLAAVPNELADDQSASRLLAPLEIAIEDDTGAVYTPSSSSIGGSGGSGGEWHGDWFFRAHVPEPVVRLTVRVSGPESEPAVVELDLAEPNGD
jgi:hypothetical protein